MTKNEANVLINELDLIIGKAKEMLSSSKDRIWVSSVRENPVFYLKKSEGQKTYISKENSELINELINNEYALAVIKAAEKQKRVLQRFKMTYVPDAILKVYEKLHPAKKKYVKPLQISIKQKVEEWKNTFYDKPIIKDETVTFKTRNNEQVRSKSEVIIADTFDRFKIPYRYECPIQIRGYGLVYPDFTVINPRTGKEFIFEHFGMVGDLLYDKSLNKKIVSYAANGFFVGENFLFTYETANSPLNIDYLELLIKHFLL